MRGRRIALVLCKAIARVLPLQPEAVFVTGRLRQDGRRRDEQRLRVALDDVQADLGAGDLNRLLAGDILLRLLVLGEVDDIVLGQALRTNCVRRSRRH